MCLSGKQHVNNLVQKVQKVQEVIFTKNGFRKRLYTLLALHTYVMSTGIPLSDQCQDFLNGGDGRLKWGVDSTWMVQWR